MIRNSAVSFAIFYILIWGLFQYMHTNKYKKTLKVAVYLDNLVMPIDPLNNATLTNAFFSNNLYSNLIDVDENNNYNLELASKYWFETENKKLFFEFEGSRVSPEDAVFTLRRLIFQNKHLHSDFWNIICDQNESTEQCSSRVYLENGKLVISYNDQSKAQYIIPTLASVDYKIIPIAAFDIQDYRVAQISDYTKTSGYYYLQNRDGKYFFVKNSNIDTQIYHEYELVKMDPQSLAASVKSGKKLDVDIISTTVTLLDTAYKNLISNSWKIFESHNISIGMLVYSSNGIRRTTRGDRFSIAGRVFQQVKDLVNYPNAISTIEIFQSFGQGYLNQEQIENVKNLRHESNSTTGAKINFAVGYPDKWRDFVSKNPDVNVIKATEYIPNMEASNRPDLFVIINDVSFDLNLSLISYAANTGLLDMSKEDLNTFANIKDEKEKIAYINAVHYKTLKECMIYPMWASPYTTAFNGDFDHNLSKFNSRTLLWKIH